MFHSLAHISLSPLSSIPLQFPLLVPTPQLVYQVCERLLRLCGCAGSAAPPHLLAPLEISYTVGTPSFTSFFLSAQYDHETRVSYSAPQSLGSPALSASLNSQRSSRDSTRILFFVFRFLSFFLLVSLPFFLVGVPCRFVSCLSLLSPCACVIGC